MWSNTGFGEEITHVELIEVILGTLSGALGFEKNYCHSLVVAVVVIQDMNFEIFILET